MPTSNRNYDRETNLLVTGPSNTELQAAFQRYKEVCDDGMSMMEESRQQECFEVLFDRSPKLHSIAIGMRDELSQLPWQAVKEFREAMLSPWGDHMSSRIGYRPLRELLLAMHETDKHLKRLDIVTVSHQFFTACSCGAECSCDNAMYHDAISRVRDLHIGINDRQLESDRPDFDDPKDSDDEDMDAAAIDAWLEARRETPHQAQTRVVKSFEDGGLVTFLKSATSLAALSVVTPEEVAWLPEAVELKYIVGEIFWPQLSTFTLHNFKCRDVELTTLLQRHRETLQSLSLCNVTFIEGSAQSCFEPVAGKLPQLQRVVLRGRFKANGFSSAQEGDLYLSDRSHIQNAPTRALQDYLIEGGQFPSEILAFSHAAGFWWNGFTFTFADLLFLRRAHDGVEDGDEVYVEPISSWGGGFGR